MGEPSLTIISLIARMCQPSCQTNPIISIIPFLGFQIKKKKSFASLPPRKIFELSIVRKNLRGIRVFCRFCSTYPRPIPHSINETWIVVDGIEIRELFHRPWTVAREEDPSRCLVIQPAATMLYVSSKEEEEREAVLRPRRGREEKERRWDRNRESRTGHDIVDESRRNSSSSWLDRLVMSLNISVFEEHELPQMTSTHPRPHPRRLLLHETSRSPSLRVSRDRDR